MTYYGPTSARQIFSKKKKKKKKKNRSLIRNGKQTYCPFRREPTPLVVIEIAVKFVTLVHLGGTLVFFVVVQVAIEFLTFGLVVMQVIVYLVTFGLVVI